ncbi:MAG: hypothetical protein CMF11_00565 [Idiomarina sp.]|nr:hypothetical protein [Idiomarina sp.]
MQVWICVEGAEGEVEHQRLDLDPDCLVVAHAVSQFRQSGYSTPDSPEQSTLRLILDHLEPLLSGLDDLVDTYKIEHDSQLPSFSEFLSSQILKKQTIH